MSTYSTYTKCTLCGQQMGPLTGDPRTFESMATVQRVLREQMFYWMKHMAEGIKVVKEAQAEKMMAPFCSSLSEGPLPKGFDLARVGRGIPPTVFILPALLTPQTLWP